MAPIYPEYFVKDELLFEVRRRGAKPQADVASLRGQLRELVSREAELVSVRLSDTAAEWEICATRWEELQSLGVDLESLPSSARSKQRWEQRLRHLRDRLVNLQSQGIGPSVEGIIKDTISEIDDSLKGHKEVAPVEQVPAPPVLVDVAGAAGGRPALDAACSGMLGVSYQHLPNPVAGIIRDMPEVDGLEETLLMAFLGRLFQLADFPGVAENTVLQLVFPYCRGPMAGLIERVMRRGGTLDDFHREVLDSFVPGRLREQLRQKHFYRVQAHGEGLAPFCSSIRSAARILRLPMSEGEVVQVILEGVTPQERSRLVFAERPRSYSDLDRLCVMSRTIEMTDEARASISTFYPRERLAGRYGPAPQGERPERGESRSAPMGRGDVQRVCFRCRLPGHFQRDCTAGRGRSAPAGLGTAQAKNGANWGR